ncbi:hypothetical protein [Singulisphaera sp. PoT]|uniref:hypothetical protein n=1 Tax=Singulisphaera sp. PoT TaxID=3411797 RepID=UPI003BF4903D
MSNIEEISAKHDERCDFDFASGLLYNYLRSLRTRLESTGRDMALDGMLLVARSDRNVDSSGESQKSRPIAITVRGHDEWRGWANRLAEFTSKKLGLPVSLSALVGMALSDYARKIGFKEEPPDR